MAEQTTAQPLPDNNGCPMHEGGFSLTCGTCNGHFTPTNQPMSVDEIVDNLFLYARNYKHGDELKSNHTVAHTVQAINQLFATELRGLLEAQEYVTSIVSIDKKRGDGHMERLHPDNYHSKWYVPTAAIQSLLTKYEEGK